MKKIIKELTLNEISGVDRPAQPTARMAIMKRDTSVEEIAKGYIENGIVTTKSFSELLAQKEDTKRIWEAREEIYPLFDALNDAVSSILVNRNNSVEMKQTLVEASVNDFLDAVREKIPDVEMELNKFMTEEITKRSFTADERKKLAETGAAMPDGSFPIVTTADLKNAIASYGRAANQEAARKHIISRARSLGAVSELPESWGVKKNAEDLGNSTTDNNGDNPMSDAKTVEELQKNLDELTEKLAEAETLAKMSDAEKAYMDKMSAKDKPAFMAMSAADRAKKIAAVAKNDETVEVAGQTISKSEVGDKQFAIFKAQADELAEIRKQAKADREAVETAKLEKRATEELPNLPGEVSVKARVLKAIDGLSEDDRKAASQMLKSANEVLAKSMETIGRGSDKSDGSAIAEIEKKAEEIAKRDGIGKAAAIAKAWTENPALYEQYEAEQAA